MDYKKASKLKAGTKLITSRGAEVFTTEASNVNHFETADGKQYKYMPTEDFTEVKAKAKAAPKAKAEPKKKAGRPKKK